MTDNNPTDAAPPNPVNEITEKLEKTTITTDPSPQDVNTTSQPDETPNTNKNQDEETKLDNSNNNNNTVNNNAPQNNIQNAAPININNNTMNINNMQQQQQAQQQQAQQQQAQIQQQQQQQQQQNQNQQISQQTQTQQQTNKSDDDETNLIINYLPPTMSEGTLATLFSPYGLLERCKIVVDLQTLRSRGYGFVKYDNAVSAERALTALNGYELNGKKLKVAFARPQCKAITNANLYITNVPPHFNDINLRKLFDDYGKIVECRVLLDQNGQSRGVGFVRMDTHHNAIQALQAMDQYVIDDKHPPLLVKLAQRRVPRRYWNSQNRNNQGGNRGGMGNNRDKYNKNKKKKNSPGRKYYPKGNYNNDMGGGNMGMHMGNKQSPNKRGYYRPRQQGGNRGNNMNQGGGGGGGNRGNKQGGNNQSGGAPYFPAPMYQQQEPYMTQYGQPAQYATNLHMTPAAMNNPNPNNNIDANANAPAQFNVLVFNLPKHFNVDHVINMYAKFGPVQSVKFDQNNSKKGRVGIISYFYFDDAQRAQNETNQLQIGSNGDTCVLETMFQPPLK